MKSIHTTVENIREWWSTCSRWSKGLIFIVLGIILVVFAWRNTTDTGTTIETVRRQDLQKTVGASGSVVSGTDLALSFEASKVVSSVRVKVGDTVKKGQILATEKNATEQASYTAARGGLRAAQAKYEKVLEGSSNEEIKLAQVTLATTIKIEDARVENARKMMLSSTLIAESDNVRNTTTAPTVSGLYTGTEGEYVVRVQSFSQTTGNGQLAELAYTGLESGTMRSITSTPVRLGTKGLSLVFPSGTQFSAGDAWTIHIPNTTSATYITNQTAYQNALEQRAAAVAQKEAELNIIRATARQPEIDASLADILIARAGLEQASAVLEKTILRAPADGTVTKVVIKVGSVPEIQKEAIVLQDINNLYLEATINETAIRDINVGQDVKVVYDALSKDMVRHATITSIHPAGTVENNGVSYTVKALISDTTDIRPAMTATLSIVTHEVGSALVLPGRAVSTINEKDTVLLVTDTRRLKTQERSVVVGIKGDGGLWEIHSGLSEGDIVLWKTAKGTVK